MSSTTESAAAQIAAESAKTSLKRARMLFAAPELSVIDTDVEAMAKQRRRLFLTGQAQAPGDTKKKSKKKRSASQALVAVGDSSQATVETVADDDDTPGGGQLALKSETSSDRPFGSSGTGGGILVRSEESRATKIPTPQWHAPWKLSTVLSSHLGWVRALAFSADNKFLATGSGDRTIKLWNFASASVGDPESLQLTLTGHISPVRGLAFSDRLAYLFSCGEDKQVKCWDLETNTVVRHYHGHLSGIFCMALHPTLDLLVTAGRDAVARVWDIRTRHAVQVLEGHEHTIASILTQSTHPQVITGSHDTTVKLWDLVAGKCFTTLTHHQKSIRALAKPTFNHTFCSGAADCLKQWQAKDGRFLQSLTGHKSIVNAMAVNDDGVLVSGGDDGTMNFWDYTSGYTFQQAQSKVQPGSLEAENSIMAMAFDATGTRLVTGEADKTIKIWKPDEEASELTHPIDMAGWRKKKIAQAKQRV
jgi:pleiotropic regulator 1